MTLSVFLHSTGTSPEMWAGVPNEVTEGTTKVTPLHLGYPPGALLPRGRACGPQDDAAHVLSQLPAGDEDIHLFAHSYGCVVAQELSSRLTGRLRSVFLFEPVIFQALASDQSAPEEAAAEARAFIEHPWFARDDEKGGTEEWLEFFIDYWNKPGSWSRMPDALRDFSRRSGWKMYQEVRSCFFGVPSFEAYQIASLPCTLLMGERTTTASRAMTRGLARTYPSAALIELPKTGHMAPITHAPLVYEAMRQHMKRCGG